MAKDSLTPLRFKPIFKPAMWGGFRLRPMFGLPVGIDPIGEVWLLSDHGESQSVVADGELAGTTLRELRQTLRERLLGPAVAADSFPFLLKFIHARLPLSIQVHPNDAKARELESPAAVGKTEAWVILEADPTARLYAGLQAGTDAARLRQASADGKVDELLYLHAPIAGDCYLIPAGTVHGIGGGLVMFEIQQTSDLTYRLYDWQRNDPKTGKPRELHVDKAIASINLSQGPCRPVHPTDEGHGRIRLAPLVDCEYFSLGRWDTAQPFRAGADGRCRVLVGIAGKAKLRHGNVDYTLGVGSVWLLPAEVGACEVIPQGMAVILECGLPE